MHILYLDDSGSVNNADDKHIILAGISVFERQPHWFSRKLDDLATHLWPDSQNLEFRGADIPGGKKHWRGLKKSDRIAAYKQALGLLRISDQVTLIGAAINKVALSPNDPMEFAFEQLCNRFDRFLGRLHKSGNTQRGLIVLDKSSYETSLQGLAINFRAEGHRWGQIYNIADVPLFVDSKATRMIQYADLIAYAMRRYYEKGDSEYFDIVVTKFDAIGGVLHGLYHHAAKDEKCACPSCAQRRPG